MSGAKLTLEQQIVLSDCLVNTWEKVRMKLLPLITTNQRHGFEPAGILHSSKDFIRAIVNAGIRQPIVRAALESAGPENAEHADGAVLQICEDIPPASFHQVNTGNSTGIQIDLTGNSSSSFRQTNKDSGFQAASFSMVTKGNATGIQVSGGTIDIVGKSVMCDSPLTIQQQDALPKIIQNDYLKPLISFLDEKDPLIGAKELEAFQPPERIRNAKDLVNIVVEQEIGQYAMRQALEKNCLRGLANAAKLATGLISCSATAKKKRKSPEPEIKDECTVCMENAIDAVILECGHRCVCYECGEELKECPLCREKVTKLVKTFNAH